MTYQMLTKWESYTEEQILSLDETPCLISTCERGTGRGTGGWIKSQNLTGKQKWDKKQNAKIVGETEKFYKIVYQLG